MFKMTMLSTLKRAGVLLAAVVSAGMPALAQGQGALPAGAAPSPLAWPTPTAENRLWTRWWWLGNAVDAENITKQLEKFHEAGLGGVEICPIYGAYGAENRYIDFLSPKWMNMLSHTYRETQRLEMKVDMTTGTGWPFGGSMVADAEASKGIVLKSFDKMPEPKDLPPGKLVGAVCYPENGPPVIADINTISTGIIKGLPPQGRYVVAVQTGPQQKVKRPAPGAEGNVVDPYSVEALNKYLDVFDKAFEGFQDDIPRGQFHDSFEYYAATWTPAFFDEFQKRRGYDLRTQLAAMNNEGPPDTVARVKCDYRETLSDLHLEYMNKWVEWSHTHGSIARNQAHGGPGNILDVYANADIPECEIFHLYEEAHLPMLKLASSGAHLTGKKLSSSESFTWLDEPFNATLAEVKPAADFLFLAGVNHMFLHGIPYSPEDAAWPGWQFYASVNFGPQGGLWHDFPAFTAYVARCQSILQANKPSNDLLLYVPFHEFWSDPVNNDKLMMQFTTPGTWMKPYKYYDVAMGLWNKGFSYDEISDKLLAKAQVAADGRVTIGGNSYRAIILPKTAIIPVATLQKFFELATAGASVVVQDEIPADVPGMHDLAAGRAALKNLVAPLVFTSNQGAKVATLGKGHIIVSSDINAALTSNAGVRPEPMMERGLRYIRRERPDGFDYFVVNRTEKTIDGVPLAVPVTSAVILDPRFENRTGVTTPSRNNTGFPSINLVLQPNESYFIRTFSDGAVPGPAWHNAAPTGKPVTLAGTWTVSFIDGGPNLPKPFTTDKLASWTVLGDTEAKRFAGTAKYTLTFEKPTGSAGDYQVDLGKVADSARVTLNGHALGTLWAAPFSIALGDALKPGKNTLEIEVTNVAANRIRDMDARGVQWKIFRDANVLTTAYTKLDASVWPVRDSGLLGPVTLTPLATLPPK